MGAAHQPRAQAARAASGAYRVRRRARRRERRADGGAGADAGRGARLGDHPPAGARAARIPPGAREHAMIVPTLAEFRALAKGGKLVPIYREVFADLDTPVSAFLKVDDGPYSFLLESVEGGEKWGRYSLLGSRPSLVFVARGEGCEIRAEGKVTAGTRPPLEEMGELLRQQQ